MPDTIKPEQWPVQSQPTHLKWNEMKWNILFLIKFTTQQFQLIPENKKQGNL